MAEEFFPERWPEGRSGFHAPSGVDEKKFPCFRSVENRSADGFTLPAGAFPFRLDVQYRYPGIIAGKNCQLPGAAVELFREIAQTDAAKRDVINQGGGKKAAIGNLDRSLG